MYWIICIGLIIVCSISSFMVGFVVGRDKK